jgi:hypothetical protein
MIFASSRILPAPLAYLLAAKKKARVDRAWYRFENKIQPHERKLLILMQSYFRGEAKKIIPLLNRMNIGAGVALQAEANPKLPSELAVEIEAVQSTEATKWISKILTILSNVAQSFGSETTISLNFKFAGLPKSTKAWLTDYVPKFVDQINETSRDRIMGQVLKGMEEGEALPQITERVKETYGSFVRSRADLIARQESGVIASQIQQDVLRTLDIPLEELIQTWGTARDNRVRDSHDELEGAQRFVGEEFKPGLKFPRDPDGEAEEVIGCRCFLLVERVKGAKREAA